jgi:GAF domain-containing protein
MTDWNLIVKQAKAIIGDETNFIANTANISALLFQELKDINWAGFYFLKNDELVLGPFQGKVACVRIPLNRGVCGAAATERKTLIVEDVHKFPEHIACDSASNSEIVVPILKDGELLGVIDIDSPLFNRFNESDKDALEKVAQLIADI